MNNLCDVVQCSAKFVNGCVAILFVCYCYLFPHQGKPLPQSLPLIRHILDDEIKLRFDQERVTGFGKGIFRAGFPLTSKYVDWCTTRSGDVEEHDDQKDDEKDEATNLSDDKETYKDDEKDSS